MIIGVDGNDANVEEQVGVSVYTRNLLEYFQLKADKSTQFKVFLRFAPKNLLPKENDFFKYIIIPSKPFWSQIFLPIELYTRNKVDVFFSPAHYSPRFSPVPTIVTVHDLAYFYFPNEFLKKDLYKLKNWTKYSVEKAAKVICVSKSTKKDLLKFYAVSEKNVDVVYNGFEKQNDKVSARQETMKAFNIQKNKYILYVGTLQPRKNIPTLIRAFEKYVKQNQDIKLVLVGKKGWLYDEIFNEVAKRYLSESVIFTGYVSNQELHELYSNAYCFVLPSLYEGFGIPLLEAMSHDCPVLSSFSSSLSEIGGDAAIYFDPENENGLLEDLNSLSREGLRQELIAKGKQRIQAFSWEKCGQETLHVIKQAAIKI